MSPAIRDIINRTFAARDRWEDHFSPCRTCGTGGRLCAEGARLHTAYAALSNSINR